MCLRPFPADNKWAHKLIIYGGRISTATCPNDYCGVAKLKLLLTLQEHVFYGINNLQEILSACSLVGV